MNQQQPRAGGMDLASFMNHSTRGGKNTYFKLEDAKTVWLSCQSSIYSLWRHGFYRVEARENRDTHEKTNEVWQDKLGCYELEEDLGKRFFRDRETGLRETPPKLCPDCIMIEDVYQRCRVGNATAEGLIKRAGVDAEGNPKIAVAQIEAELANRGEIWWLTPLFAFHGTDSSKDVVLHAGGLFNAFGNKDLDATDKAWMARVPKANGGPIYAKNAWKENLQPKMEYVYVVVDHDKVANGLQVAVVTSLLGDKMRKEIAKRMKATDKDRGNPILHPYAFRWEHNSADGIPFNEKYDATAMPEVRITPAIEKLIRDTPPPDLSGLLSKFNLATHRARLEKYALVQLPWDQYFAPALKAEAAKPQPAEEAERPREVGRAPVAAPAAGHPQRDVSGRVAAPPPAEEDELVACDVVLPSGEECGNPIKLSDPSCPKCRTVFNVQAAEPPPPAKPPLRKRTVATAAPAPAAAAPRGDLGAIAPPADLGEDPGGFPGDPTDDLPF